MFFFVGSGVFSPIGSNLSVVTGISQSHPVGVIPTNNNTQDSPRTLGVTTATGATPSALKNVRSSATRSLTELSTAPERTHDGMPKSYSDTKLISSPKPYSDAPSATRHQSSPEPSDNLHGIDVDGDNRQPFSGSITGTDSVRPAQGIHVSNYEELNLKCMCL